MRSYLRNYGWHFSKKAQDYAASLMKRVNPNTKHNERVDTWTKEQVDHLLSSYGVKLENAAGYDYVYVANMCKADYLKSSIPDEHHLAMYVKDTIDDVDGADGVIFRQWYAGMVAKGLPIDWEDML